jgi:hypothetical protein
VVSWKSNSLIIALLGLIFSFSVQAFNGDNCKNLFPDVGGDHPPYLGPIYITTMFPSTSSYFSSTGPCALYGILKRKREKEVFVASNWEQIKFQMAVGKGPHLKALVPLLGCPDSSFKDLAAMMKNEFDLFNHRGREGPKNFLDLLNRKIQSHSKLAGKCFIPS